MQMGKLEKFVAKRIIIILAVLSLVNLIFMRQKLVISAGLLAGSAVGMLRFSSLAGMLSKLLETDRSKNKWKFRLFTCISGYFLTISMLIISGKLNKWFFAGVVASILIIPAIIMVNCFTENFGLTNNHFE